MCSTTAVWASDGVNVRLGSGRVAGFRWNVDTVRDKGPRGMLRPCLAIDLQHIHKPSPPDPLEVALGGTNCRRFRPTPSLFSVVDELDTPHVTVVGMAFEPQVHSVSMFFSGSQPDRTIPLTLLSNHKAKKAQVVPFRYGTLAFAGSSCVSRFVAHARDGHILDDGGPMHCRVHPDH
jgi:hypothetical protein